MYISIFYPRTQMHWHAIDEGSGKGEQMAKLTPTCSARSDPAYTAAAINHIYTIRVLGQCVSDHDRW